MRHRVFILLLACVLILAMALLRNVAEATPFNEGKLFDTISLWDMRIAVPFGIFSAGLFIAIVGMGAQLAQCMALAWGKNNSWVTTSGRIALSSLWCGWPFMAACLGSLIYVVPDYFPELFAPTETHSGIEAVRELLPQQLYISIILLVLCRFLIALRPGRRWVGIAGICLVIPVIISTTILWARGNAITILLPLIAAILATMGICLNGAKRYICAIGFLATATGFISLFHTHKIIPLFPSPTADYIIYSLFLLIIMVLQGFKMVDLSLKNK